MNIPSSQSRFCVDSRLKTSLTFADLDNAGFPDTNLGHARCTEFSLWAQINLELGNKIENLQRRFLILRKDLESIKVSFSLISLVSWALKPGSLAPRDPDELLE